MAGDLRQGSMLNKGVGNRYILIERSGTARVSSEKRSVVIADNSTYTSTARAEKGFIDLRQSRKSPSRIWSTSSHLLHHGCYILEFDSPTAETCNEFLNKLRGRFLLAAAFSRNLRL